MTPRHSAEETAAFLWDGKPRWAYELDLLLWEWNRLMEKQAAEKRRERKIKKQIQRKKFGRR